MGHSGGFENLKQNGINTDSLAPEALEVLNQLMKDGDIFPEVIMRKAVEELMASDPLFNEAELDREASINREYVEQPVFDIPEEKQAYIKEFISLHTDAVKDEIMTNPNKYYTQDLLSGKKIVQSDYYGEKAQNQGTDQPDTRA